MRILQVNQAAAQNPSMAKVAAPLTPLSATPASAAPTTGTAAFNPFPQQPLSAASPFGGMFCVRRLSGAH
jgi:hypothetical protein